MDGDEYQAGLEAKVDGKKKPYKLPKERDAVPAVPDSLEMENGVSICQHSNVDAPLEALRAVILRLKPWTMGTDIITIPIGTEIKDESCVIHILKKKH